MTLSANDKSSMMLDNKDWPCRSRLAPQRMQLRYGFNEVDGWWHLSLG